MSVFVELVGPKIQTKDGVKDTTEVLNGKNVVGLYFSAHWCPPCRGFTPILSESYEEVKELHEDWEIVFVSSDRDENEFGQYYGEMPFCAVPYSNREQKDILAQKYGIRGIPTLIFLNGKGEVITADGRSIIAAARGDASKIWNDLTQ